MSTCLILSETGIRNTYMSRVFCAWIRTLRTRLWSKEWRKNPVYLFLHPSVRPSVRPPVRPSVRPSVLYAFSDAAPRTHRGRTEAAPRTHSLFTGERKCFLLSLIFSRKRNKHFNSNERKREKNNFWQSMKFIPFHICFDFLTRCQRNK